MKLLWGYLQGEPPPSGGRAGENAAFQEIPPWSVIGRGVDIVFLHGDGTHHGGLKPKVP